MVAIAGQEVRRPMCASQLRSCSLFSGFPPTACSLLLLVGKEILVNESNRTLKTPDQTQKEKKERDVRKRKKMEE